MTPRSITQLLAREAEKQEIPTTCHRIQLAGAVDAMRRGEEPKDVFGRLGYGEGTGELGVLFRRSIEG